MATRGKGARIKGASFERTMAKELTQATGIEFERGLGQTRRGGAEIPDVFSHARPDLHIETKRQKSCNIKQAIEQAKNDTVTTNKIKIIITKDDHKDTLVTMTIEDWMPFFLAYLSSTE